MNKTMKPTGNGGWHVEQMGEKIWVMSDEKYLAEIVDHDDMGFLEKNEDRRLHNAYLMAAAPALFDAAKKVLKNWDKGGLAAAVRELGEVVGDLS